MEEDLHLNKKGPFSSLEFTDDEVKRVADAIAAAVNRCLADLEVRDKKVILNINQGAFGVGARDDRKTN